VEVCHEFNVPMFFYCVDNKWGSPAVWLRSDDPAIVAPREWLMGVIREIHREGARGLPLESANFSTGESVVVAGDEKGIYEYVDNFAAEDFLDDATICGFLGLTWDGEKEILSCDPIKARVQTIELQYHFVSPFQMSDVKVELTGNHEGPSPLVTVLEVSGNGRQWLDGAKTNEGGRFSLAVPLAANPPFSGREFWVRVGVTIPTGIRGGCAILDQFRVTCRTALPERRETCLLPDAAGNVSYVEDFGSRKYLHLAEIRGGETLAWRRGGISTHGVKGSENLVQLRWKFVCSKPLRGLRIVVEGAANGGNLGATNAAGLSIDGKTLLASDTTAAKTISPRAQGWCKEPLTLDAGDRPELSGVREFCLHLEMKNTSGVLTNTSNKVTKFTVSAVAK
jgi:hypothetical protein